MMTFYYQGTYPPRRKRKDQGMNPKRTISKELDEAIKDCEAYLKRERSRRYLKHKTIRTVIQALKEALDSEQESTDMYRRARDRADRSEKNLVERMARIEKTISEFMDHHRNLAICHNKLHTVVSIHESRLDSMDPPRDSSLYMLRHDLLEAGKKIWELGGRSTEPEALEANFALNTLIRNTISRLRKAEGSKDSITPRWLEEREHWSIETFGQGLKTKTIVDHIMEELREIETHPNDPVEWIDVILLAIDGAARTGLNPDQILHTLMTKYQENTEREWKKNPEDGSFRHVKEPEEEIPTPDPRGCLGDFDATHDWHLLHKKEGYALFQCRKCRKQTSQSWVERRSL